MSASGHSRAFDDIGPMSAFPSTPVRYPDSHPNMDFQNDIATRHPHAPVDLLDQLIAAPLPEDRLAAVGRLATLTFRAFALEKVCAIRAINMIAGAIT
jgi:hypothetical protein